VRTIKKAGAGRTGRAGSGKKDILFLSPDPARPAPGFSIVPTDQEPRTGYVQISLVVVAIFK